MMNERDAQRVYEKLATMHPNAGCELSFRTPFELLVAVILSAQCTDARVNKVTEKLFAVYNTPQQFASLTLDELTPYIFSCGFYNNKGKNIIAMSRELCDKYDGKVPEDFEQLNSLAGVGRKTASVVTAVAFHKPAVPVDTHVNRVSLRIGLSEGKTVEDVEKDIKKSFPPEQWNDLHHYLIFHGRYVCHSRSPECDKCALADMCAYHRSIH